jgi:hypothetical protein
VRGVERGGGRPCRRQGFSGRERRRPNCRASAYPHRYNRVSS